MHQYEVLCFELEIKIIESKLVKNKACNGHKSNDLIFYTFYRKLNNICSPVTLSTENVYNIEAQFGFNFWDISLISNNFKLKMLHKSGNLCLRLILWNRIILYFT